MLIELDPSPAEKPERYPLLKRGKQSRRIVMFTSEKEGFYLDDGRSHKTGVGDVGWDVYEGTVTLRNG